MGTVVCRGPPENIEEIENSKRVDELLRKDLRRAQDEIKLLLLGAGESGKSTIAKQMRILYTKGYTEEEKLQYREIIFTNVILGMRNILLILEKRDEISKLSEENQKRAVFFLRKEILFETGLSLSPEIVQSIKALWSDEFLQAAYVSSTELQISESAPVYFNEIDRLSTEDYLPTEQDILLSRTRTTGISEVIFPVSDVKFRMVDVGGQRSERKKWIHCFQDCAVLIFCTSLSEYDQVLVEDERVNRLTESLVLFSEVLNCQWFAKTTVVLFLNKSDIFAQKIKRVDLSVAFPVYTGGKDFKKGCEFMKEKFCSQVRDKHRIIHTHVTCATDTKNVKIVFGAVRDVVLSSALSGSAL